MIPSTSNAEAAQRHVVQRQMVQRQMAARLITAGVIAGAVFAPTVGRAQAAGGKVSAAALAEAYRRVDRAYHAATLPDSTRDAVNRVFDRSTMSYLSGKFPEALARLDSAATLTGVTPPAVDPRPAREVNGRPASVAGAAFLARLAKLDTAGPLAQALVSARARAQLLVDNPTPEQGAAWRSDPAQLARDLAREVSVLERGRNPYVGQAGDAWHTFRGDKGLLIPFRLVAPSAAATSSVPVPVVIVLHGAGGDENTFIDAYGRGIVASMGIEARAIIVSPAADAFKSTPVHFDSLMAVLRSEFRVNNARVYLVGHSMGAGIAASLAQLRPTQITAVACLAGGSAVTVANAPAVLFVAASLDPLVSARSVEAAAKKTPTGTYKLVEHEGHTLMVASAVKLALPWLLDHRP